MESNVIDVARDFTRFPGGRYLADGPFSGQRFRDEILVKALRSAGRIIVKLDGAMGYGSSFLEEAFAGLYRLDEFRDSDVKDRFDIRSSDKSLVSEVEEYLTPRKC